MRAANRASRQHLISERQGGESWFVRQSGSAAKSSWNSVICPVHSSPFSSPRWRRPTRIRASPTAAVKLASEYPPLLVLSALQFSSPSRQIRGSLHPSYIPPVADGRLRKKKCARPERASRWLLLAPCARRLLYLNDNTRTRAGHQQVFLVTICVCLSFFFLVLIRSAAWHQNYADVHVNILHRWF